MSNVAQLPTPVMPPPRDVSGYDPMRHGARCDICPLRGEPHVPFIAPEGGKPRLIIVGEGPGVKETIRRVPFVGVSGRLLDDTLEDVGVERGDCYITNAALCIAGHTYVRLGDGSTMRIDQMVKQQYAGEVETIKDGVLTTRRVTGWYRNARANRKMLDVSHVWARRNVNGANRAAMTEDHRVLTDKGWVEARDVHGKMIATGDSAPGGAALDVTLGTLLGDGSIGRGRGYLTITHAAGQRDYAELKARLLAATTADAPAVNGRQPTIRVRTYSSGFFRKLRVEFYPAGKKRIPRRVIRNASDLLIAIWFLDDGHMRTGGRSGINAEIAAAGFPRKDVEYAAKSLRALGFDCKVSRLGRPNRIVFSAAGARVLSRRIARYVPPSMQYKLLPEHRGCFDRFALFDKSCVSPFFDRAVVRPMRAAATATVYCIDVEETHNFVTTGAVAHNCRGETDKDNDRAAECCAPRLLAELATQPKDVPIVALGKAAARSILGVKSILLARGFVWTTRPLDNAIKAAEAALRKARRDADSVSLGPRSSKSRSRAATGARAKLRARVAKVRQGAIDAKLRLQTVQARHELAHRVVCPTVHPAFVLRSDAWTPIMKLDLDRAARVAVTLKGPRIRRVGPNGRTRLEPLDDQIKRVTRPEDLTARTYLVTDNPDEIRAAAAKLGPTVSCDIETTSDKPLSPLTVRQLCAAVSDGDCALVVGPFDVKLHASVLSEVLAHRDAIVFHNGYNFDQIAQERDGIVLPQDKIEDTLVAHHTFGSQYPQKLDHVVSVFCDSGPWKIKHGRRGGEEKGQAPEDLPEDELYEYNAKDAVLTAKAWRGMQSDLDDERAVYEHDKALSLQGKRMQVVGIRIDRKRKRLFSTLLHRRAAALKGRLRKLARDPHFQPTKLGDVRRVLFGTLRAPMLNPTSTGLASTSNATLEALRTGGIAGDDSTQENRAARFAEALLRWRVTVKVKSTYVDAVPVQKDQRVHYNWRPYGTVSGRYSSRIQSCPRWSRAIEERVREMYIASPGCTLVYFDLKQAEGKGAAVLSGDPVFIAACEKDIHAENAKILFPAKRELLERDAKGKYCPKHGEHGSQSAACNCGKMYRDISKNFMYGVNYGAEAKTLLTFIRSQGFQITLDAVDEALCLLKAAYHVYFRYAAENIAYVEQHGYLRSAIVGRKMWLGFHPKPNDVYNRPVQSVVADAMNIRTPIIEAAAPPGVKMIFQGHDAAMFDTPHRHVDRMLEMIPQVWAEPFHLKESCVVRSPRDLVFGADVKSGHRWSEL